MGDRDMSTSVNVNYQDVALEDRPSQARMIAMWALHVDGDYPVDEAEDGGVTEGEAFIEFYDTYQISGLDEGAVALSARFPLITITTTEAWRGDEPSTDIYQYRAGELVASTVSVLQPTQREVTSEQYDALCAVIDRVKLDEATQDTDVYAAAAVEAIGMTLPTHPAPTL